MYVEADYLEIRIINGQNKLQMCIEVKLKVGFGILRIQEAQLCICFDNVLERKIQFNFNLWKENQKNNTIDLGMRLFSVWYNKQISKQLARGQRATEFLEMNHLPTCENKTIDFLLN